jgi:glycerol-3-phosphate acyltransferase PlsY
MPWIILGITISYLIGSIPTAYIFGRLIKGIDIRKFGSGNVGATNALRVLGKGPGILVLFLDIVKGILPVYFLADFVILRTSILSDEFLRIIFGFCCISGHNWTVFLRFKGGKGVATSLGVLIGLSLKIAGVAWILGLAVLVWLSIFVIFRIISLSSIAAAISLPVSAWLLGQSSILLCFSSLVALVAIFRHKANIIRLLKDQEPRLSWKKNTKTS